MASQKATGTKPDQLPAQPRAAHRRHGQVLADAIFDAMVEILLTTGYRGLRMDTVAAAAGTGKAALYRRWPDKESLLVEGLDHLLASPADLPDSGDVRADLLYLLRDKANTLNSRAGRAIRSLLAEIERDRPLLQLVDERVFAPRQKLFEIVLERGRLRGEVRAEPLSPLVAELGPALLMQRFLGSTEPVPDEFIVEIVDGILLPLVRA